MEIRSTPRIYLDEEQSAAVIDVCPVGDDYIAGPYHGKPGVIVLNMRENAFGDYYIIGAYLPDLLARMVQKAVDQFDGVVKYYHYRHMWE